LGLETNNSSESAVDVPPRPLRGSLHGGISAPIAQVFSSTLNSCGLRIQPALGG
jgi:hypothetical protein